MPDSGDSDDCSQWFDGGREEGEMAMSNDMTMRLVLIGSLVAIFIIGFAMNQDSYAGRSRKRQTAMPDPAPSRTAYSAHDAVATTLELPVGMDVQVQRAARGPHRGARHRSERVTFGLPRRRSSKRSFSSNRVSASTNR